MIYNSYMKAIFNRIAFYGALIAIISASCTDNEEKMASTGDKVAVRISANVQTRAAGNVWNENDAIGITMLTPQVNTVINSYRNYAYITSGDGNFSPADAQKIMYFPADGRTVSFKAYYPYKKDLPADQPIPVSVKDQTSLAGIDLMTAEHTRGFSIDDPNVQLHFYHRLAKVIINLTTDNTGLIDLKDCKLTIKGLKTTGTYNLVEEALTVDNQSDADINIPIRNASGEAIILPRAAGEGVVFEIATADGGSYTAIMAGDLELKAGYKHTFHIRLKSTPVEVSATIEPWAEGPERHTDAIRLVTGLKDSKDFQANDTLRVFLKDQGETDFSHLTTFTYQADGTWSANKVVYWEGITADPAAFRGATIIDDRLNSTQMPDILVSKDVNVKQYTGVNLEMEHAGAKVTVLLKSADGTFTANDLAGATIVLPGYLNSGSINEKGEFVIGATTTDITPQGGIAIFPPQTIAQGKNLAVITINGRTYEVPVTEAGGFAYAPGVAHTLTVNLGKSKVEVSAVITPWTEETHEFQDVRIGSANLTSNGGDVQTGDQLFLYTGNDAGRTTLNGYFRYSEAGDTWTYSIPSAPLYWEDIANTGNIYASITRPAVSNTPGNNQLSDYITATPVTNDGGVTNTALNFSLRHDVAKVIVMLRSSTYTLDQLQAASVTLPDYQTGATLDRGVFVPGTVKATIMLDRLKKNVTKALVLDSAYIQPQNIAAHATIVRLNIAGRIYEAQKSDPIAYEAGKATTLILTIEKSEIKVSAEVKPWTEGITEAFSGVFFTTNAASAKDFADNDQLTLYKLNAANDAVTDKNNTYQYYKVSETAGNITSSHPWYRDDFSMGDRISAVFPSAGTAVANGSNSFDWTCSDGNGTVTNAHEQDVMVAAPTGSYGVISAGVSNVALQFRHVLSKVTVNLIVGEGFTAPEMADATVELNNFRLSGTVNVTTGTATHTGAATAALKPTRLSAPYTISGKTVVSSYEAFIMPQSIMASSGSKMTIATVTLNGVKYLASIEANKPFTAGAHNVLNLTLNKVGLSLSAEIVDWIPEGSFDLDLH